MYKRLYFNIKHTQNGVCIIATGWGLNNTYCPLHKECKPFLVSGLLPRPRRFTAINSDVVDCLNRALLLSTVYAACAVIKAINVYNQISYIEDNIVSTTKLLVLLNYLA